METKTTLSSLDYALQLAGRGWYVFPCKADKKPATPNGFKNATSDPAEIRNLWAQYPGELVGIACEMSGFFALDIDIDPEKGIDGKRTWAALCEKFGNVAAGPAQLTPRGGLHILFTLPEGLKIPNNAGKLAEEYGGGLDLRSNGYICTGTMADGRAYQWQEKHGPEARITPPPAWLVDLIRAMKNEKRAAAQPVTTPAARSEDTGAWWVNYYLRQAREGTRNNSGFDLACQLRDSGMVESEAEPYMLEYARRTPGNGYTENEALASLKSAFTGPRRDPARRFPGLGYSNGHHGPELSVNDAGQEEINAILEDAGAELPQNEGSNILLTAPADHDGHAHCVLAMFPGKFLYCEAYGWLYYTGTHYQREGAEAQVDRAIVDTLKARRALGAAVEKYDLVKACHASAGNKNGVKDLLQSLITEEVGKFDNDPDRLNCNNGVLDLRTGELLPHDQGQRFTYCLPVDYDPKADRGAWVKFLLDALGNPEMVDYLQVATGYSLTGQTWEEILFYLYGPPRSGKGTFTETIIAMMGMPLATEADFATFTAERSGDTQNFDLAPLKPCRFVAAGESNKNQPLNPAKIKALTGRNFVRCAFKHRDHFTYQPAFKIWLSSNHPVNVDVDDDAAWGRVRVIDFPHSHLGEEDKSLKARLSTPAALRGVLAWAVEGAQLWYNLIGTSKGLPTPERIAEATQAQRDQQDYIKMFLGECCGNDPEAFITSTELYQAYKNWCEDNGASAKHLKQFTAAISRKGYETGKQRKVNGRNLRGVIGLKLER